MKQKNIKSKKTVGKHFRTDQCVLKKMVFFYNIFEFVLRLAIL